MVQAVATNPGSASRVEETRGREMPLSFRANFLPSTRDEEQRTVELVLSTGAAVERRDWWTGERWIEELSLDPKHVRLERLNGGAPLLDMHYAGSVREQLGVIVPDSARIVDEGGKRELRATAKFSARAEVEGIWRDVVAGIVRNVSIGYRIYRKVLVEDKEGEPKRYRCEDWEAYEASMVTMGADPYAGTRSASNAGGAPSPEPNDCVLVRTLPTMTQPTTVDPKANAEETRAAEVAAAEKRAADAEAQRQTEIRKLCRTHKMAEEFVERALNGETRLSVDQVRTQILNELATRDMATDTRSQHSAGTRAQVGVEERDKFVRTVADSLVLRSGHFRDHGETPHSAQTFDQWKRNSKPLEGARDFAGLSMKRLAQECLRRSGLDVTRMGDLEICETVLGLRAIAPGHSSADFPEITGAAAGKLLRMGFEEAPRSFLPLVRSRTVDNFKPIKVLGLSTGPSLKKVGPNGEYKFATFGETGQTYAVSTYGIIIPLTREAMVNDDLDAFARIAYMEGAAAARMDSDLYWALRTAEQVIDETGQVLYHASHNNTGSGALSITALNTGMAKLALQRGPTLPDGSAGAILNIRPRFLVVPVSLFATAVQLTSSLTANTQAAVNPFAQGGQMPLTPIAEARLDAESTAEWYLDAAPGEFDTAEMAELAGQQGVYMEQRAGFERDGIAFKARREVGFSWVDFRGTYRSTGS